MPNYLIAAGASAGILVADGITAYFCPIGGLLNWAVEIEQKLIARDSYTLSNLYVYVSANGITVITTVKSRKDTEDGNQSVSIPASATGAFTDSVNTDSLADGDLFCTQVSSAFGGTTIRFTVVSYILSTASNTTPILAASHLFHLYKDVTRYLAITGSAPDYPSDQPESTAYYKFRVTATLSNLRCYVHDNGLTSASTVRTRVNGENGSQSVSIPGEATGAFEDTTNSDNISVGQNVNYQIITGTAPGSQVLDIMSVQMKSNSAGRQVAAASPGATTLAKNLTRYVTIEGDSQSFNDTETKVQATARTAFTAKNMYVNISANTITNTTTFTLRKDTDDSALTVSVPSEATGQFEDTEHTVGFVAASLINWKVVTPDAGTAITIVCIGFELAQPGCIDTDDSGEGYWSKSGDQFDAGEQTYEFTDNKTISLYGQGPRGVYEYVRTALVSMGNLVTVSRVVSVSRDASVLVGSLVSASRAIAVTRLSSVLIGNLVTAAKFRNRTVLSSVLIGSLVSASRILENVRTSSVLVGVLATASRLLSITKTSSILVGNLVSAFESWGRTVTSSVLIGILVVASRLYGATRTSLVLIGNLVSASRIAGITRASAVLVGNLVTAKGILTIVVTATVTIGNLVSASEIRGAVRTSLVLIGNLVTASGVGGTARTSLVLVGNLVSASRIRGAVRKASTLIGNLVSATIIRGTVRAALVLVGSLVSSDLPDGVGAIRKATVRIGVLASASRAITTTRLASVLVGNLVSAYELQSKVRESLVRVGSLVSASRSVAYIRSAITRIGVLVSAFARIFGPPIVATLNFDTATDVDLSFETGLDVGLSFDEYLDVLFDIEGGGE